MTRAASRTLHRLMALLTVLAAFAFQVRADGSMPGWWMGVQPAGTTEGLHPASHTPGHGHSHSHGHAARPVAPAPGPRAPVREAHDHGAHCPFCITGAFSLAALPGLQLTAPERWTAEPPIVDQEPQRGLPVHVDARAPPAAGHALF